jgi:predicted transcriptional regulator
MKKRDKLELIRRILQMCQKGTKKTRIVYQVNLNFRTAGNYLDLLINEELIAKEGNSFKITAKGDELLANLQNASAFLGFRG